MGVGTQDHIAAGGEGLTGILMDNRLVGRHIDAAVLLGRREAEHVVVLVDGTAHCAEGVVAVGHRVGQRESFQSAGASRLDDAHIGNVVGHHRIEADTKFFPFRPVHVVGAEDAIGNRVFPGLIGRKVCGIGEGLAVQQVNTILNQFYHNCC